MNITSNTNSTNIGETLNFSTSINTSTLSLGEHSFKLYLRDIFGVYCWSTTIWNYGYMWRFDGEITDAQEFSFGVPLSNGNNCVERVLPKDKDIDFGKTCPY